jgi:hypothetical protein
MVRPGTNLEEYVLETLPKVSPTGNSGAMFDDADGRQHEFVVECKEEKGKKPVSFSEKDLLKLIRQALNQSKEPLAVLWNKHGKWAILRYDCLCEVLERAYGEGQP